METGKVDKSEEGISIRVRCRCGPRTIPLRWNTKALVLIHWKLGELEMDPELVIFTYRCRTCKDIADVTARDLHLT